MSDRPANTISLTDSGAEYVKQHLSEQKEQLAHLVCGLPPEDPQATKARLELARIGKRELLLEQNLDVKFPLRPDPSRVKVTRTKLSMPAQVRVPTPGARGLLVRIIASHLTRRRGETDEQLHHRIRAYAERALLRMQSGLAEGAADEKQLAVAAASDTVKADKEAIESEFDAGGPAKDEVAETMSVLLDSVAEDIDAAAEDLIPCPVELPHTPEVEDKLVEEAELLVEAVESIPEPVEVTKKAPDAPETLNEELVDALPVVVPSIPHSAPKPFYKDRKVQALAAAGVLGLWYFTRRAR